MVTSLSKLLLLLLVLELTEGGSISIVQSIKKSRLKPKKEPVCEYECEEDKSCILETQVCDGMADCPSGSDEEDCPCKYECEEDNSCLLETQICNGWPNCPSGSDEEDCPSCGDKGYESFGSKMVDLTLDQPYTYEDCKHKCEGEGGRVLTTTSVAALFDVYLLYNSSKNIWLGIQQINQTTYKWDHDGGDYFTTLLDTNGAIVELGDFQVWNEYSSTTAPPSSYDRTTTTDMDDKKCVIWNPLPSRVWDESACDPPSDDVYCVCECIEYEDTAQ